MNKLFLTIALVFLGSACITDDNRLAGTYNGRLSGTVENLDTHERTTFPTKSLALDIRQIDDRFELATGNCVFPIEILEGNRIAFAQKYCTVTRASQSCILNVSGEGEIVNGNLSMTFFTETTCTNPSSHYFTNSIFSTTDE